MSAILQHSAPFLRFQSITNNVDETASVSGNMEIVRIVTVDNSKFYIGVKQSRIQFNTLVSSPRKIIDSARRTLFISRKSFRIGNTNSCLLSLSFTLHEDLQILVEACGNGRFSDSLNFLCGEFLIAPDLCIVQVVWPRIRFASRYCTRFGHSAIFRCCRLRAIALPQ